MTVSAASFQGQEFKGSKISAVDGVMMYKGYSVVFNNTAQLLLCRRCRGTERCMARCRGQINIASNNGVRSTGAHSAAHSGDFTLVLGESQVIQHLS